MSRNMDPFEKFCRELRAVVVSSPVPVDLRSLKRGYKKLVGEPMPLQRFGYKDILTFLREKCWDFFKLEGAPNNPIVTLIVPKALEHIDRMVKNQKLSARDRKKGRRWSLKKSDINDEDYGRNTFSSQLKEVQTAIGESGIRSGSDAAGHSTLVQVGQASATNLGCSRFISIRIPSFRTLAAQLTELIADYPDGLWFLDMVTIYRNRYGQDLRYEPYGFKSGIHLLRDLEDIVFHIRRPDPIGDWRVYSARLPPPPEDPLEAPVCTPSTSTADAPSSDFVSITDTIRSESIAAFEPSTMIDVIVSQVYSPSQFWVIRYDEVHCGLLYAVRDVMTKYYDIEGAERSLTDEMEVCPGVYCAARSNDMWHRAVVLKILDPNTALVRYIDYGTVNCAPINSLKPLLKEWKDFPAQAIRARLAGVIPPWRVPFWPYTSTAEFLRIVTDDAFVAEIVAVDHKENIIEVFLVDTSEAYDVCVNDLLIQQGFAEERFDSVLGKNESHLWPTFEALESGLVLSYADVCGYIEHVVLLKFIDSYRQYVFDDPSQPSPMQPSSMPASMTPLSQPLPLPSERREFWVLPTFICSVFGKLLPSNYKNAMELAWIYFKCCSEPKDATVSLTAEEYKYLKYLRSIRVAVAAIYLDLLVRRRLPPDANYPISPPLTLIAEAAYSFY